MSGNYDDILRLPHHVSSVHPPMSRTERAAQFSPFAALTGYGAAVRETARLTDQRVELAEDEKAALDLKLQALADALPTGAEVTVTCFRADERKAGGAYCTVTGEVKRIDELERMLVMQDRARIPIDDILALDSDLFRWLRGPDNDRDPPEDADL